MVMPREERRVQLRSRLPRPWDRNGGARQFTLFLQPADAAFLQDKSIYTYEFQPARPQKDPLIRLIRAVIEDLNAHPTHEILMCNNNIRVVPSTSAPPIWPPTPHTDNNIKFYTFFQDEEEFPVTVPISILPRLGRLTKDKVHVRENGKWIPIEEWLLQSLANKDLIKSRGVESVDYFWRRRSKKTFRLMDLPIEIRLMIFEHVISKDGEVYPRSKGARGYEDDENSTLHVTFGYGYKTGRTDDGSYAASHNIKAVAKPVLTLLYVSKQVKEEALRAGWEGLKRCFVQPYAFVAVADSRVGVAIRYNILGRIQLSFSSKDWFIFFGIYVCHVIYRTESQCRGHYLASLDRRTNLEIRFRDPEDGYDGDPWGHLFSRTTCQTVIVNWILTLAFQYVKHIRGLKIVGYVRKPQVDYWQDIFAKERANVPHFYDNEAALKSVLNIEADDL
ncbi:hypothetical protein N0V83_000586 [Neocucurbitaria cava]|uniref:Uncharacterized protein n=1 Tax=Neocucurbitaria cava TaxID=798079 RepID=A0A9W8YI52_9PLEO|nr:hypothetical protein N0V83_000586 [Neocucurbitaria cava]